MTRRLLPWLVLPLAVLAAPVPARGQADEAAVRKAVTLYASFDKLIRADHGGGKLTPSTRFNHETEKGKFVFKPGYSEDAFHIAAGRGVAGGALEARDVLPRKSTVTLSTNPAGLQLKLDGVPVATPYSFVGVVGINRKIEAPSPQAVAGTTWVFSAWSDGRAQAHVISTPSVNKTYTATFVAQ